MTRNSSVTTVTFTHGAHSHLVSTPTQTHLAVEHHLSEVRTLSLSAANMLHGPLSPLQPHLDKSVTGSRFQRSDSCGSNNAACVQKQLAQKTDSSVPSNSLLSMFSSSNRRMITSLQDVQDQLYRDAELALEELEGNAGSSNNANTLHQRIDSDVASTAQSQSQDGTQTGAPVGRLSSAHTQQFARTHANDLSQSSAYSSSSTARSSSSWQPRARPRLLPPLPPSPARVFTQDPESLPQRLYREKLDQACMTLALQEEQRALISAARAREMTRTRSRGYVTKKLTFLRNGTTSNAASSGRDDVERQLNFDLSQTGAEDTIHDEQKQERSTAQDLQEREDELDPVSTMSVLLRASQSFVASPHNRTINTNNMYTSVYTKHKNKNAPHDAINYNAISVGVAELHSKPATTTLSSRPAPVTNARSELPLPSEPSAPVGVLDVLPWPGTVGSALGATFSQPLSLSARSSFNKNNANTDTNAPHINMSDVTLSNVQNRRSHSSVVATPRAT